MGSVTFRNWGRCPPAGGHCTFWWPRELGYGILIVCLCACPGCGKKKSTDELIGDLRSQQEKEKLSAVRLLPARTGEGAKVIPALIEALKDSDGDIRRSAAIGLGGFGEEARDAIAALKTAQHDRDARVRESAKAALSRIDPTGFPGAPPARPAQGK